VSNYWSSALDLLLQLAATGPGRSPEQSLPATGSGAIPIVAGLSAPKTRLLSRAMVCPDVAATARVLMSPGYRGQIAAITESAARAHPDPAIEVLPCDPGLLPVDSATTAAAGAVRNLEFSSNRAVFEVTNDTGRPAVLTYSDAWSEHWLARVNDAAAPVLRADVAYKAVVVPPGASRVVFEYRDRLGESVFRLQTAGSVAFLGTLIALGVRWRRVERGRV
jgi:hypothetical protein